MNCLSLDTFVMTKDGLKRVTDITLGEKVYAFDQKTCQQVLKKCTGIFDNGIKKVYEVSTLHHAIKATANHPFLVVKRQGRGKKTSLVWKTLENLTTKDEVVVQKKLSEARCYSFKKIAISKKGDYKVNKIREISLPKRSSPALMEFLGLYVGDGWIRTKKAETGFALPSNTKGRKLLLEICNSLFTIKPSTHDKNYIYLYSVNLAKFIDALGFGSGARNKLIPDWVFTLPATEKEAFLKGLLLSDGYAVKNSKSRRYVSASMDLLKTLRLLLQTMHYQVGKIHQQTKKKGTHVVYRQLLEDSTYGYIAFSKKQKPDIKKYASQTKQRDFLADNEFFSTERITSITYVKEEPTIDLRVEGEHNFIADGIVVHNTGVQRSSSTPFGTNTKTTPPGKASFGKNQYKKDLTAVVAGHHIPYVAQASPHNYNDLIRKAQKAFATKGPAFINVISPCVPGWGYSSEKSLTMAKLAVDTCFWPLYHIENDVWTLDFDPKDRKKPITEWLKSQARFRHLFKPENADIIKQIQEHVDKEWERLKKQCGVK
ncbi:MAG: LAGLIDADG family homing endonuclease [Nanoarchaeota archaeon]